MNNASLPEKLGEKISETYVYYVLKCYSAHFCISTAFGCYCVCFFTDAATVMLILNCATYYIVFYFTLQNSNRMVNTSVMDFNSHSAPYSFRICLNGVYLGMVVVYVAASLCFLLGTPAHSWLLWCFLHSGWKVKPTQVFSLNLLILELINCIQCAVEMLDVLIFNNRSLWRMSFVVFGLIWVGRPLMQTCICVEQYLAVLHPIIFLKYKGIPYRIVCASVVWLMAAGYSVFEGLTNIFPDAIFNSTFFISVIVISFCCVSVLRALKHPGPGDTHIPVGRGRDPRNQQKRKAFNTIFSGLLIILFTFLPQTSLSLFHLIQIDNKQFYCNIVPIVNTFNILGVTITPLLKIYKKGVMKWLKLQRQMIKN